MRLLAALLLAGRSVADIHHLFTSSFSTPHIYGLEFDDKANTLISIANITAHGGHPWLSFSYDKTSLYAGESNSFVSYSVLNGGTDLAYSRSVSVTGTCSGAQTQDSTQPFVIAELRSPFAVYTAPYGSCGAAIGVDVDGHLDKVIQNIPFRANSAVQGMALDPENTFLYSADEKANGIWTHSVDEKGKLTQVAFTPAPRADSGPRHLVVHPDGKYLYVVLSKTNAIAVFAITTGPTASKEPLKDTGVVYSLLPQSQDPKRYTAGEIFLSADSNVLYSSTRFRTDIPAPQEPQTPWGPKNPGGGGNNGPWNPQNPGGGSNNGPWNPQNPGGGGNNGPWNPKNPGGGGNNGPWNPKNPGGGGNNGPWNPTTPTNPGGGGNNGDDDDDDDRRARIRAASPSQPGYITGILLTPLSEEDSPEPGRSAGAGFPVKILFQNETLTSGGLANFVSPAPWGNDYFALVDSEEGAVEVWKLDNLRWANYTGPLAQGSMSGPAGGWTSGVWQRSGSVQTHAPEPTVPQGGNGGQNGQPAQPAQPAQPQGPWNQPKGGQSQQGGYAPWQWDSQQGQRGKDNGGNQPWNWNNNPTNSRGGNGNGNQGFGGPANGSPGWTWGSTNNGQRPKANQIENGEELDDDDDEPQRKYIWESAQPKPRPRAAIDRFAGITSRPRSHEKRQAPWNQGQTPWGQAQAPAGQVKPPGGPPQDTGQYVPPPLPPVRVRRVARWKSPVGGGTARRREASTANDGQVEVNRKHVVNIKPWTGSKKRYAAPPPVASVAQVPAVDGPYEAEIRAAKEGKSCCANAVWFD